MKNFKKHLIHKFYYNLSCIQNTALQRTIIKCYFCLVYLKCNNLKGKQKAKKLCF